MDIEKGKILTAYLIHRQTVFQRLNTRNRNKCTSVCVCVCVCVYFKFVPGKHENSLGKKRIIKSTKIIISK
jgi:hypothetical protein